MISTRDLSLLPDVNGLHRTLHAIAALSAEVIARLNPEVSLSEVAADVGEIGYPGAP